MLVISGPCAIESEALALEVAERLAELAQRLPITAIYKSSFDKANRTAITSPRGVGLDEGLRILAKVREQFGLPVITDVHECAQVAEVAAVVDVLQVPAFLSRQTDLLLATCASGRPVMVKKGQFMAPGDMAQVVAKAASVLGGDVSRRLLLCERGTSFGHHDLVVDMRGLAQMRAFGCPVIYDATHSLQQPSAVGTKSGGQRKLIPALARAAVAVGVDGLFIETHPRPDEAQSDAATVWPLDRLGDLLEELLAIDVVVEVERRTVELPMPPQSA
jgi:2-dehydro-3-deoxyphosphooctonate aldolase (KDO 8-P synthase)